MSDTPIADMVDGMVEAEAKPAAIAVAVRALETAVTALPALSATNGNARSRKAVNQATYRARLSTKSGESVALAANPVPVTQAATDPVTPGNAVTTVPLSILPSLTESQELPKEEKKQEVEVLNTEPRVKAKRGSRMTEDWYPDAKGMKIAADRGLRLVEIEIEITKFRNYWINRTDKQASKPRWDLAWENWVLNVKQGSTNGQDRSVIAASDRLNAKLAEFAEPDLLGGIRGEAGPADVRLLPARRSG